MKRAIQRALAQQDIGNAFDYYLRVAGATTANDFVLAIDALMGNIERFPESGSLRYAELLEVNGMRFSVVERFPYLIFYFERADHVDVARVLHQHRDVPAILEG